MKKWKYFVMFFALLALLTVTAYAEELEAEPDAPAPAEEVAPEETPEAPEEDADEETPEAALLLENEEEPVGEATFEIYFEGDAAHGKNISLFDVSSWNSTWTTYGEQLTGRAKEMYDEFDRRFLRSGTEGMTYGYLGDSEDVAQYCASIIKTFPAVPVTVVSTSDPTNTKPAGQAMNKAIADAYDGEIEAAIYAFSCDHPEYFWIRSSYVYSGSFSYTGWKQNGTNWTTTITPTLSIGYVVYYGDHAWETDNQLINAAVTQILKECEGLPIVAKLAYFDNWLAENNAYNSAAADASKAAKNEGTDVMANPAVGPTPWNTTSALRVSEKGPVCEGYAKAFQLLCHEIGVPCITVSSSDHMWNMVRVDGNWYHVDCTWNDPIVGGSGSYNYSTRQYFLIADFGEGNSTGIAGSHTINQNLVHPQAEHNNYFSATSGWSRSGNKISGYVDGNEDNNCWLALYSDKNQMLGIKQCASIPWGADQVRYLAPEFDSSILSKASSGKSFWVDTNWKPMGQAESM